MPTFKILGGHGRVALLLARILAEDNSNRVYSLVRNPNQFEDVKATGAEPVLFDIENATVNDFASVLNGADFVVWSAGAGGVGGPSRTYAIDRDAAMRSMQAARQAVGVSRYVMVSYLGAEKAPGMDKTHPLYHYGQAKHVADKYLKESSGLNYTIVKPGPLNHNALTGTVDFHANSAKIGGRSISRHNVAFIISTLFTDGGAFNHTLNKEIDCLDGDTPVLQGLRRL